MLSRVSTIYNKFCLMSHFVLRLKFPSISHSIKQLAMLYDIFRKNRQAQKLSLKVARELTHEIIFLKPSLSHVSVHYAQLKRLYAKAVKNLLNWPYK